MTTLYQRLLPHPHLAPWTDDYPDGLFSAHLDQAHYTDGRNISLNITFNLESPTLEDLVQAGMAAYAALVDCPSTFTRRLDTFNLPEGTILLPSSEFSADFTATPHVVAITDLTLPSGPEIAEEYRSLRPAGIDLSAGAILATGGSLAISPQEVAVHSVIDLVTDSSIRRGAFTVTLDDNRIKIKVTGTPSQASTPCDAVAAPARRWQFCSLPCTNRRSPKPYATWMTTRAPNGTTLCGRLWSKLTPASPSTT